MVQSTVMKPLALHGIDQGQFIAQAEIAFAEASKASIAFARKHGTNAKKAKAKLVVEISLLCVDPESELFQIATSIKLTPPTPPARTTLAMGGDTQDEQLALFAKQGGSSYDSPEQGTFTDEEGGAVN